MRVTTSAIVIAAFFALLPAVSAGGAMGLPVLMCLAAVLAFRPSLLQQAVENKLIALLALLAFWGWALAASAWSAQPGYAQAGKLAALVPLGLMFAAAAGAQRNRDLTQASGVAAFAVLTALMVIEALWDMPLNRAANPEIPPGEVVRNINRGAAVVLALTWGAAASLLANDRGGWARVVLAASALLAMPLGLWANLVAFLIGLVAFAVAYSAPRFAVMSVSAGLAFWMIAAPFATPLILANQRLVDALPLSWAARVGIWDYVCARIMEQPWLGHGLDASRAVTDQIAVRGIDMSAVPLHPHSGSLQIWYETGAVGAALAAATLLAGGWAVSRAFAKNRPAAAAAAATLASLGIIANVSFGIWQEWWNATMFVAAALVAALARARA
ncbi:MAG TPA: O-antigen ligase family protein [Vitreimonas sp.]|uniref:O-antigen ligase family protein n=1 Tax=Vitreimonas sp. TaxID=3069702 RepID=UPI002D6D0C70|nr:O-antigen ligase family protein [Vitreimonas sp.]HYD87737.1 O-antigen ligase family protein [Vitreimonas sp.]